MRKKYRLVGLKNRDDVYAVQSLVYIPGVVLPMEIGGLVDSEDVLDQYDDSWITKGCMVRGGARIRGNVVVDNHCRIFGNIDIINTEEQKMTIDTSLIRSYSHEDDRSQIINCNTHKLKLNGHIYARNMELDNVILKSTESYVKRFVINNTGEIPSKLANIRTVADFNLVLNDYKIREFLEESWDLQTRDSYLVLNMDIFNMDDFLRVVNMRKLTTLNTILNNNESLIMF